MAFIIYGKQELKHLKNVDPKLKEVIESYGFIERKTNTDLFSALIENIISQQISTKAATTIYNSLTNSLKELTPENILTTTDQKIKDCGVSFKKISYIKSIASAFVNKTISYDCLKLLSDQEIIKELTKLKGIGIWTAEMLLIHTFLRPNVISYGDFGIKKGLKSLYGLNELSKEDFNTFKSLYSPYGTVASIYLWEFYARNS